MTDATMAYDFAATHPGVIVRDRERAIAETEGVVGRDVVAAGFSAANVFVLALDRLGVSTDGVHPSAYPMLFRTVARRRRAGGSSRNAMGYDSAAHVDFDRRFPSIARIKQVMGG